LSPAQRCARHHRPVRSASRQSDGVGSGHVAGSDLKSASPDRSANLDDETNRRRRASGGSKRLWRFCARVLRRTPNRASIPEWLMPIYRAPVDDYRFLLNEFLEIEKQRDLPRFADLTPDLLNDILGNAGKFCEEVLQPLNQPGDEEGCHFENGVVRTPKGFKD